MLVMLYVVLPYVIMLFARNILARGLAAWQSLTGRNGMSGDTLQLKGSSGTEPRLPDQVWTPLGTSAFEAALEAALTL